MFDQWNCLYPNVKETYSVGLYLGINPRLTDAQTSTQSPDYLIPFTKMVLFMNNKTTPIDIAIDVAWKL